MFQKENIRGTGKSKQLEAIKIQLTNIESYEGTIEYQTHVANVGWQSWRQNNEISGTTGKSANRVN